MLQKIQLSACIKCYNKVLSHKMIETNESVEIMRLTHIKFEIKTASIYLCITLMCAKYAVTQSA